MIRKTERGGLLGVILIVPVFWGVISLSGDFGEEHSALVAITTVVIFNLLLAWFFSEKKKGSDILLQFFYYSILTVASGIVITILLVFIALKFGWIKFSKIGG